MDKLKKSHKDDQILSLFIDKYNWEQIDYVSGVTDQKRFLKSNQEIAPDVLYITNKRIYHTYTSKWNSKDKKYEK